MVTIEAPRKIGNLNLSVLTTHHHKAFWDESKSAIKDAINQHDHIAVEYYPPEYNKWMQSTPVLGSAVQALDEEKNYLFNEVAGMLQKSKKDVWVLDPAYGGEFVGLRALMHLPPMTFFSGLSVLLAAIGANNFYQKHKESEVTRRDFLKAALLGTGSVLSGLETGHLGYGAIVGPSGTPGLSSILGRVEDDFRENVTAENLITLGKTVPEGKDMLFITTPLHWAREDEYLKHDRRRKIVYAVYNVLFSSEVCKPFFKIRHYPEGVVV